MRRRLYCPVGLHCNLPICRLVNRSSFLFHQRMGSRRRRESKRRRSLRRCVSCRLEPLFETTYCGPIRSPWRLVSLTILPQLTLEPRKHNPLDLVDNWVVPSGCRTEVRMRTTSVGVTRSHAPRSPAQNDEICREGWKRFGTLQSSDWCLSVAAPRKEGSSPYHSSTTAPEGKRGCEQ